MKTGVKILIGLAVVVIGLILAKDFFIKMGVEMGATKVLGTPVHIGSMTLSVTKQNIHIKNLIVENPPGFDRGQMINVPEIEVTCDVAKAMKGDLHLSLLTLNLQELNVIRNKEGKLNVDALKVAQKPEKEGESKPKTSDKNVAMQIDTLNLNLGKVTTKDYTQTPTLEKTLDLNIKNKTYHNITSGQQLAALVLVETLKPTAIKDAAIYGAASLLQVPVNVVTDVSNQLLKKVNLDFLKQ